MNRRLPQLAILVVLLVAMVGVFHGETSTPTGVALAQEAKKPTVCGPWKPYADIEGEGTTPGAEAGFEVDRTYMMSELSNSDREDPKSLTEITLFKDGELSVPSEESAIIAVDSGLVQLTVCGEGTQVGIQLPGENQPTPFGPADGETEASIELPANSAVFIDPDDPYFLTGLADGEGTPTAAVQQLDFELSSNALPGAQSGDGGSRIKVVTGIARKLCGGAGC